MLSFEKMVFFHVPFKDIIIKTYPAFAAFPPKGKTDGCTDK